MTTSKRAHSTTKKTPKVAKKKPSGGTRSKRKAPNGSAGAVTKPVTKPSPTADNTTAARSNSALRIVALGASAGGLEPLEQFFKHMPNDSGLSFVVIQHLSPDFRSMMDELLARYSTMRIERVSEDTELKPNTVYLNPPRKEMVLQNNKLVLRDDWTQSTPALPINAFMESLAAEAGADAVGIILSGTGSDGTLGVQAIKEAGGHVLVQEPNSAKFDGMPRSALAAGRVAATALPSEMGALVMRLVRGEPIEDAPDTLDEIEIGNPHREILKLLNKTYGQDFNYYKLSTVDRRIQRRALMNGISDLESYALFIRSDPQELEQLYCDLLIGVTAFFRDKDVFNALREEIIPKICQSMSLENPVRVWVPGCASGEEAYSIAILLSEYAREKDIPLHAKIFASDIHFRSLDIATRGEYLAEELQNMPPEIVSRYFEKSQTVYRVRQSLRSLVVFSRQNLIKDPPFTRMNLITCRNLLIYLNDVAQKKAISVMHFGLAKQGILLLGPSETTGELTDEFEPINAKLRLYKKRREVTLPESTKALPDTHASGTGREARSDDRLFASREPHAAPQNRRSIQQAYDAFLDAFAAPGILTDPDGQIIHVFGKGLDFIEVKSGAYSGKLQDVIIEPFRPIISVAIERIRNAKGKRTRRSVRVPKSDGTKNKMVVAIEPLPREHVNPTSILFSFETLPEPALAEDGVGFVGEQYTAIVEGDDNRLLSQRLQELERDLQFTEESLQSTIEELETSNEELQATNEEMMSANEELQSTNEELHSVNEELYTVTSEHQRKIEELTEVTNDREHLLSSTDVGVLFLDRELCIRRFTPSIARLFNLLDRDIGRPIDHFTSRVAYPNFLKDVHEVLHDSKPRELEVKADGLSYLLRILPYKSPTSQEAEGAVVTLVDITRLKDTERTLELRNDELRLMNENLEQFTYIVSHDLRAPLRAIRNSAQWISDDAVDKLSPELESHLGRIRTQAGQLSNMLRDLLHYSKLGSEEQALERVSLERLVQEIPTLIEYGTEIQLDTGSGLPTLVTHRAPMHLIFQNLIDNAAKYSNQRVTRIKIRHRNFKGVDYFLFADDGPGIEGANFEQIFLPFRKLEHPTDRPGTGMGLALVKKAIETRGGRVKIKSNKSGNPKGTRFIFSWDTKVPAAEAE